MAEILRIGQFLKTFITRPIFKILSSFFCKRILLYSRSESRYACEVSQNIFWNLLIVAIFPQWYSWEISEKILFFSFDKLSDKTITHNEQDWHFGTNTNNRYSLITLASEGGGRGQANTNLG